MSFGKHNLKIEVTNETKQIVIHLDNFKPWHIELIKSDGKRNHTPLTPMDTDGMDITFKKE